jgi:hypothetical protein
MIKVDECANVPWASFSTCCDVLPIPRDGTGNVYRRSYEGRRHKTKREGVCAVLYSPRLHAIDVAIEKWRKQSILSLGNLDVGAPDTI